jgi:hypothetical protein
MMCGSDTINPITKQQNTRWSEAHQRLKAMVEILAYVPFQQVRCLLSKKKKLWACFNRFLSLSF